MEALDDLLVPLLEVVGVPLERGDELPLYLLVLILDGRDGQRVDCAVARMQGLASVLAEGSEFVAVRVVLEEFDLVEALSPFLEV